MSKRNSREIARAIGEGAGDRPVRLRLIGWHVAFRDPAEMLRAVRHRYLLAHYVGFAVLASLAIYGLELTSAPVDLLVPAVVLGIVALLLLVSLYLRVAVAVMRGRDWVGTIWVTPALMLGTVAMTFVASAVHDQLGAGAQWEGRWAVPQWVLTFVLVEAAATVIFRGPLPRAVAAMRAGEPVYGGAARSVPLAGPELAVEEPGEPAPDDLRAGTLRIARAAVSRLEASGNYVVVVTATGRHLVPGPFSAVAAGMPERMGRKVHRSHWVATGAVTRLVRTGRDMWLVAVCGAVVPVAASMQDGVQVWLAAQGIALERGPRPVAERVGA